MSSGILSRADLLRILAQYNGQLPEEIAELIGYHSLPDKQKSVNELTDKSDWSDKSNQPEQISSQLTDSSAPLRVPFWQPVAYYSDNIEQPDSIEKRTYQLPQRECEEQPEYPYLANFMELIARLRSAISKSSESTAYDIKQIVNRIGQGEFLQVLPRQQKRGWGGSLYVVEDRSDHLAPYVQDQSMVTTELQAYYSKTSFTPAIFNEFYLKPQFLSSEAKLNDINPQSGDQILILSDLGCLQRHTKKQQYFWTDYVRQLKAKGVQVLALVPFNVEMCSSELSQYCQLISWEHPQPPLLTEKESEARCNKLIEQLSIASRIEPALLREIRLSLNSQFLDSQHYTSNQQQYPAYLESLVWQHPLMDEPDMAATSLHSEQTAQFREAFKEDSAQRRKTASIVKKWMAHLSYEFWLGTVSCLGKWADVDDTKNGKAIVSFQERADLAVLLNHLAGRATPKEGEEGFSESSWQWIDVFFKSLSTEVKQAKETRAACRILEVTLAARNQKSYSSIINQGHGQKTINYRLYQQAEKLVFQLSLNNSDTSVQGSLLSSVNSKDGYLKLYPKKFWRQNKAPEWAVDWGYDEYGIWSEFQINEVVQRMRWISPGKFLMGSVDSEQGHSAREAPQHEVIIKKGYWLFDTPVTQALWLVVMGNNPSEFKSLDRPVENVTWNECKQFIKNISKRLPSLELNLPTEQQWEYACRAGSTTALYHSEIDIIGENNAPALDSIAWYGGNSGEKFELENGYDNSNWKELQYDNYKPGSHPVAQKSPNAWGLWDMLGNVFEWTCDEWKDNYTEAPTNEIIREENKYIDGYVIRGGSWGSTAANCRSASRFSVAPDGYGSDVGFRCALFYDEIEDFTCSDVSLLKRIITENKCNVADCFPQQNNQIDYQVIKSARIFELKSDKEYLIFHRRYKPHWASAMGRDICGLWCEFKVITQHKTVTQKMRWIPPGKFLMGSQKDEKGHYSDEAPQHQVIFKQGYWLFNTPVTQALWETVMSDNPSEFKTRDRPVERVSWDDCQNFIKKLNVLKPGLALSLPSESQWEYACRAGTQIATYPAIKGSIDKTSDLNEITTDLNDIAWYSKNSANNFKLDNYKKGTHPVAGKLANQWGLYDMLGNVWEWMEDNWHSDYHGAPVDGSAWIDIGADYRRVVRGGGWGNDTNSCRSASRYRRAPGTSGSFLGFRCAKG